MQGENWVAAGPEDDVQAFIDGIEHMGAAPPGPIDSQHRAYMQARTQFLDVISIVPEHTVASEFN